MGDQSLAIPADAKCLGCGYALRELTIARCPECGSEFNPLDTMSFRCSFRTRERRRRAHCLTWGITAWALATIVSTFLIGQWMSIGRYWSSDHSVFAIIPGIAIGLVARSRVRQAWGAYALADDVRFQRRVRRWLGIVAVSLSLLFAQRMNWSCPHGTGFAFGPFVITFTGPDGMCRNDLMLHHRYQITERISFYFAY